MLCIMNFIDYREKIACNCIYFKLFLNMFQVGNILFIFVDIIICVQLLNDGNKFSLSAGLRGRRKGELL